MSNPNCYFAHHITDYGTEREAAAVGIIEDAGFSVVNPNSAENEAAYKERGMEHFLELVDECDTLAFQRFETGQIGAGVGKEIRRAAALGHQIYEVLDRLLAVEQPIRVADSAMSVDDTRALLRAIRSARS